MTQADRVSNIRAGLRSILRLVGLALALLAMPVLAQSVMERLITPGPLSAPHARLEANCASCHASFQKSAQNARCATCHKGVAADAASASGFHGKFGPARGGACNACHAEHKGRSASLIHLDRRSFNHAFTNYPLAGGHARVNCAGCHGAVTHFRGTARTCAACHASRDPHRGQLGRECQTCHTPAAWKPPLPFDHARTGFALTGGHRQASCLTCHAGQRWKGLGTGCVACHAKDDAHRGSRGTACAQCHTTAGWKTATFDHASTGFPLNGGHAGASCAACHGSNNAVRHPPRACSSCHAKDDVHKGANGPNCASCHTSRGWKQVAFDHDRMTHFPLRGAHREAECSGCHKQPARDVKPPTTCIGCHAKDDTHKGANGPQCQSCHAETSWKKVSFDHNRMTRFPLLGHHVQARCESCHVQPANVAKPPLECGACHSKDDVHKARLGSACGTCHNAEDWKARVAFDHALTRFPLLGRHAGPACSACHVDRTFAAKGVACASCHVDDHHKGTLGPVPNCGTCHTSVDWKAWHFDHERETHFSLSGRHQGLICSACHARPGDPAKVGTACIDCHARDDKHHGNFGDACERCHVTADFRQIHMDR